MIDLSKLHGMSSGDGHKSEVTAAQPHIGVKEQHELNKQRDRYLQEQRDRIVKTSALKLNIYRAFKENAPTDELIDLLLECVAVATNDKAFEQMCK